MRGYIGGKGWMLWRENPGLGGLILWGQQSEETAREIIEVCSDGLGSLSTLDPKVPFLALLDLRRAGGIDPSAFTVFHAWLVEVNRTHPDLRVVLLCDRSPESAALLGLVQLSAPRIILAVADEIQAILKRAHAPRGLLAVLDATIAELMAPSIVEQLRAALLSEQGQLTLVSAARVLGMSVRTLQRSLEREGTTFEGLRSQVRRRVYEALVRDSSLKIDAVAATLGFGSVRAFSTAFRRAVGVSPRMFRRRSG